jgi:hypothetical protein
VGVGRAKGKSEGGLNVMKYFICMCENRIKNPDKIV